MHAERQPLSSLLAEQASTLHTRGVDIAAYADALIARYCNRALKYRTWQIAMDGSQKLPHQLAGQHPLAFA